VRVKLPKTNVLKIQWKRERGRERERERERERDIVPEMDCEDSIVRE
jgi:hypothetical protein